MDTESPTESEAAPTDRNKAQRLFAYLKELCGLRATQVRKVEDYDQVFWVSELPRNRRCRAAIWRLVDPLPAGSDHLQEPWIEVQKPVLKRPPELPADLDPWVKDAELADSSLDEPRLLNEIPRAALQGNSSDVGAGEMVSIEAHPHIAEKWARYLDGKWRPWAVEDRELQKVQRAYNQLFSIYQRQEKLGEQYEAVIGVGLLSWRSPHSGEINRHVLTIPTLIEFDRVKGLVSVGPSLDTTLPQVECAMLEKADTPNPGDLVEIEKDAKSLDGEIWVRDELERVLRGFAHALPVSGDYERTLAHGSIPSEAPLVRLAPALILRRRTRRTFEAYYQQILDDIGQGGDIPENIRRLIGIVDDPADAESVDAELCRATLQRKPQDPELYFPLPANLEQREIVERVERRRGVLVQGPPGTGKSHTIANLVSHFLATGKRVLVTSETPRALQVLRKKLPREIEELCVVWLGSGPESQKALEKSVAGITRRKTSWDRVREQELREGYTRSLDTAREEQARLRGDLREHREAETRKHSRGRYGGSLQQIAMQVSEDKPQHEWFADRPSDATAPAATVDELLRMLQTHRALTAELAEQLGQPLFPLNSLVAPDEFQRCIDCEQRAQVAVQQANDDHVRSVCIQLGALDRTQRDTIRGMVDRFLGTRDALAQHFHPWVGKAAQDVMVGHDRVWRQIRSATIGHIEHIESVLAKYGKLDVAGLGTGSLGLLDEHVADLKMHLENGKGLGFWLFRPRTVRTAMYVIESVTVNGRPCSSLPVVTELAAWIGMKRRLGELHELWKEVTAPPTGEAALQCSHFRDSCAAIEQALELHQEIEGAFKRPYREYPGIHLPAWHSETAVREFRAALKTLELEEDLAAAREVFAPLLAALDEHMSAQSAHRSTALLRQAVEKRDCSLYRETYESLRCLHDWAVAYRALCDVYGRFRACAPRTCDLYDQSYMEPAWSERFESFPRAWEWAQTERWLSEVSDKDRVKSLQRDLECAAVRERDSLRNLAASKAWQYCMDNLHERERMALIAWTQAVGRIRGGTGKYAETHRETARKALDECRAAIPAWIMPLYQIVQTTKPRCRQFDVVIVDEASQSGPEALFLNYIADKLIVVGDDKQITPMHVGIDRAGVEFLRRKYLGDVPHQEALDLESSLFSQAELRFPDRIRLREHFRCMPEIIQFSNNLCYSTEPLCPLRQYGADRLEPLRAVFVKEGYRKGRSEDIVNLPEASAIVAQIADCCENPQYAGRTFGVICLKGGRQAELISNLLMQEIGAEEVEKRRIVCGRPYDFQGDERDVIFLSLVDAPTDGVPVKCDFQNLDLQRRYNVAASRARDQLWLFHSVALNDLRTGSYQYRLLEYCQNPSIERSPTVIEPGDIGRARRDGRPPEPFESWFEVDVYSRIVERGFRVLPQYEVANYRIDLVVEGMRGRLAVECDGDEWHGPDRYEADMARQRDLERCGWTFWRVRGGDFYHDQSEALAELWVVLDRLEIVPQQQWESARKQAVSSRPLAEGDGASVAMPVLAESPQGEPVHSSEVGRADKTSTPQQEGRLDRVVAYARSYKWGPEELPAATIQNAVLQALRESPKQSCAVRVLTGRVAKILGLTERDSCGSEFERRVMRNLGLLRRRGVVEDLRAENTSVRLVHPHQEMLLLG